VGTSNVSLDDRLEGRILEPTNPIAPFGGFASVRGYLSSLLFEDLIDTGADAMTLIKGDLGGAPEAADE